jgi:energy-converting hydrogenase Eha subunit A
MMFFFQMIGVAVIGAIVGCFVACLINFIVEIFERR